MVLVAVLIAVLFPSLAHSTVYWASSSGSSTGCSNFDSVDEDTDPGVYAAPNTAIACLTAGDSIEFKAGTYSSTINWSSIPSGVLGNLTTALCEGDRTCIIRHAAPSSQLGVVTFNNSTDRSYIRFGRKGRGFKVDANNCGSSQCKGIYFIYDTTAILHGAEVLGNWVTGHHSDGISLSRQAPTWSYDQVVIEYNLIDQQASPAYFGPAGQTNTSPPHSIYVKAHSGSVRFNTVTAAGVTVDAVTGNTGPTYGIHCYFPCNNVEISRNLIKVPGLSKGIAISQGVNNLAYRNVLKDLNGNADICIGFLQGASTSKAFHNTCDGFDQFAFNRFNAGAGNQFRNNICVTGQPCAINDDRGDMSQSGNLTGVATNQFKDRTNFDYSLVAGSTLIDAGMAITGYAYNGSNPDRGAYETFLFTSCSVEQAAPNTIRTVWTNNVSPPLLPASGATTFTARRNGANNALTGAVTRPGDGLQDIPVTTTYTSGNTSDFTLGSPITLTDSSLIGGSINQPYVGTLTNQACTNNVGGAPAYTLTQARYELHYYRGLEALPEMIPHGYLSTGEAENFQNYKLMAGGRIRIRFAIVCSGADCPDGAFSLRRSTGGGYTPLTDSFGVSGGFKFCGDILGDDMPSNGGPTTGQLTTAGTHTPGGTIFTSSAIPTITGFLNGRKVEMEYCIEARDTAVGFVDLRVYHQDGTSLDAYTVTPRLVIEPLSAGGM